MRLETRMGSRFEAVSFFSRPGVLFIAGASLLLQSSIRYANFSSSFAVVESA
jgi:hypothetical protein